MILVSACLAGQQCRYDGTSIPNDDIVNMVKTYRALPVCPEEYGGLPIPRFPSEIVGGDGFDVIDGGAWVIDKRGNNVTENYIEGAIKVLKLALSMEVKKVILKTNSPACGCGFIYDGTFRNRLKRGDGVCTALLKRNNIIVETK
ncbi:DUF523 domain-containing protein [Candidatus Dependentiae bacterium]|nr:DUF523 domain-containing protein [Candidatus Dependentiae bacterium]